MRWKIYWVSLKIFIKAFWKDFIFDLTNIRFISKVLVRYTLWRDRKTDFVKRYWSFKKKEKALVKNLYKRIDFNYVRKIMNHKKVHTNYDPKYEYYAKVLNEGAKHMNTVRGNSNTPHMVDFDAIEYHNKHLNPNWLSLNELKKREEKSDARKLGLR